MDLRRIVDQITAKGAVVHFVKEHLTFSAESTNPRATLVLGILGSFSEFKRAIIRERQAEGIALAKKAGKHKGRKRALTPEGVEEAVGGPNPVIQDRSPRTSVSAAPPSTELTGLLSPASPLFSEIHQLRSIIHAARQSIARQQQPQDLDKGLGLITAFEERIAP